MSLAATMHQLLIQIGATKCLKKPVRGPHLKVLHDFDQFGAVRRRKAAALVQDGLQLLAG